MTTGSLVSSITTIAEEAAAEEAIAERRTTGHLWVKHITMLLPVRSLRADGDGSRHGGHHRGQRAQRVGCGCAGANGCSSDGLGRGDGDGGRAADKPTQGARGEEVGGDVGGGSEGVAAAAVALGAALPVRRGGWWGDHDRSHGRGRSRWRRGSYGRGHYGDWLDGVRRGDYRAGGRSSRVRRGRGRGPDASPEAKQCAKVAEGAATGGPEAPLVLDGGSDGGCNAGQREEREPGALFMATLVVLACVAARVTGDGRGRSDGGGGHGGWRSRVRWSDAGGRCRPRRSDCEGLSRG
jgi:hypothetical protein